jgi:two-component system alkaline phosphatase synthesis response regulator PhoP
MGKKCILIVEDEGDILSLYKEFLEDAGFEVQTAKDGEEGLEKISEGKAEIVLLDIMMPKLDGVGVLQTLKEQKRKLPKIVMMTNLSHDETLKEAAQLGATESIIKSDTTPDKVLEKINHLLET